MKNAVLILLFLVFPLVLAHGEDIAEEDINKSISNTALNLIYIASAIILIITIISISFEEKLKKYKVFLFLGIIIPVIFTTIFLTGSTIYLNIISQTKGPVHWHADFEIWNCGNKIDMIDPIGLSNRVGSPVFHEHGDDRIHVEGVLKNKEDANLDNFFHTIGGDLHNDKIKIPTNDGLITLKNNDLCNGLPSKLQVFVYKTREKSYHQEKLGHFEDYILSPYSNVPPGDCIIIEFSPEKEQTNRICETYRTAIETGDIIGS